MGKGLEAGLGNEQDQGEREPVATNPCPHPWGGQRPAWEPGEGPGAQTPSMSKAQGWGCSRAGENPASLHRWNEGRKGREGRDEGEKAEGGTPVETWRGAAT